MWCAVTPWEVLPWWCFPTLKVNADCRVEMGVNEDDETTLASSILDEKAKDAMSVRRPPSSSSPFPDGQHQAASSHWMFRQTFKLL